MTEMYESLKADDSAWERHFIVLRHIVRGRWDQLREMALSQRGDDDSFCHFVIGQHLAHFVVARMTTEQQTALLPERWMQTLQAELLLRRDARDLLKERLAEIAKTLSDANLDYRILKGLPFAQRYMGDVSFRRSADIDLLVHEQDVDRTLSVLYALEFRDQARDVRTTKNGPTVKKATLHKAHELTLVRGEIQIDLHWRFRTAPAYRWRDSEIWAQRDEVCVDGVNYPVVPDEYALVLLLVSTAHDIARGGCRLKHLLDVHHMLYCNDVQIDWPKFLENRRPENTLKICVNMLMMVLDLWEEDGELPQLRAALSQYAELRSKNAGTFRTRQLVRSPRGGVENKLWFAEVYGVSWPRDALWILRRSMPHPTRWPLALSRIVRFCAKRISQAVGGASVCI